ncbi:protein MIZU-KUSSEI 1 [Lolium perenne]|uniref:protein MIZU-KUSSEI 1 n=1 Tax=Lolium perenne TaxID=4522 RepID=UPI0021EA08FA|nr:protein MIZU-KUSSEI 1-like [Lolium perenne]
MTQPPRRPTATAENVFLGATSKPSPRPDTATDIPTFLHPPPPPPPQKNQNGSSKHRSRPARLMRSVRAAFRSFPILPAPSCRGIPSLPHLPSLNGAVRFHGSTRTTGTLYGRRRSRITIAFHDSPGSPPVLLLEMCVPTAKFIQDVSAAGMVRVTLECDKKQQQQQYQNAGEAALPLRRLLDEPTWAAEVNGESVGYASRREPTEEDERVMRLLHATSMGAGVLPDDMADPANGELTYMRAHFDRVVGSKDSETYYMHNLEGTATGPELTIFFVRN